MILSTCLVLIKHNFSTGFFSRYSTHGNPFDDVYVEDEAEDVLAENGVSSALFVYVNARQCFTVFKSILYTHRIALNRSVNVQISSFLCRRVNKVVVVVQDRSFKFEVKYGSN